MNGTSITNAGNMTGASIGINGSSLLNKGIITSTGNLTVTTSGKLTNAGTLNAAKTMTLTAGEIDNKGKCFMLWCTDGNLKACILTVNSTAVKSIRDLNGDVNAMVVELNKPAE